MFEQFKKLWREAKQKSDAEWAKDHTIHMMMSEPECQRHEIDPEISALIEEMNRVGIHTACSCQGHDGGDAYVSIHLGDGTAYEYRKDIFGQGQDELVLKWKLFKPVPGCNGTIMVVDEAGTLLKERRG